MRSWWPAREEVLLDHAPEERGPGGPIQLGRQWQWRGKHRLDAAGKFVCSYKSHRTRSDIYKAEQARVHRDSLARDKHRVHGEVGTEAGTICKHCSRIITGVVSFEEWVAHQEWRDRNPSYGGQRKGYRAWFELGAHPKPAGGPVGRQWKGRHVGEGEAFRCNYLTVLRRSLRIKAEAGGCSRCGRLRSEGANDGNQE